MQYKTIWSVDSEDFDKEVTAYLKKGWKLQGGVSISYDGEDMDALICQAITKEDDEDEK
jgi:hypothetical protein